MAVNVNFDLATTAAVLLHAGLLTSHEVDSAWLSTHTGAIREIKKKITVTHDPALTLMVLKSGKALPTGRKALGKLTLSNLLKLRARYSKDYHSSLFSPKELAKWLRVGAHELFQKSTLSAQGDFTLNSAIPLYFPNRVTIGFSDGTKETVQVDLPVGAFCSPLAESALREKFLREAGRNLPPQKAAAAFEAGLALESLSLARFLAMLERTG
jgi:2-methylcitrate dehydratase PrpD